MTEPTCRQCGIENVRLYRPYGNFFRPEDNRCNRCLTDKDRKWYVPLILDDDGEVWGHTSAPDDAVREFMRLPEADTNRPIWTDKGFA